MIINTKDGRQLLSTGVPIFDRNGNICRIYCNLRDITELEQLKERIEESHALVTKHLVELNDVKHLRTMESHFVAHSGKMKEILETAYKIARVDVTVLILGESGVGKELVARILHGGSARAKTGPFVKLNCGAIPGGTPGVGGSSAMRRGPLPGRTGTGRSAISKLPTEGRSSSTKSATCL